MARTNVCIPCVFEFQSYVTGHHMYKYIWTPTLGEKLSTTMKTITASMRWSFKRERSGWTCSPWYFNVFYLHNFVWEDCKMWDYREKTKQTWNGLEVWCKYIVKGPFHLILNVENIIKRLLIEDNKDILRFSFLRYA